MNTEWLVPLIIPANIHTYLVGVYFWLVVCAVANRVFMKKSTNVEDVGWSSLFCLVCALAWPVVLGVAILAAGFFVAFGGYYLLTLVLFALTSKDFRTTIRGETKENTDAYKAE